MTKIITLSPSNTKGAMGITELAGRHDTFETPRSKFVRVPSILNRSSSRNHLDRETEVGIISILGFGSGIVVVVVGPMDVVVVVGGMLVHWS